MTDYTRMLADEPFGTEPDADCILQCREEVVALCGFIEAENIRSYLEIGVWTGRLVRALHRIFAFDLVAACDQGWAEQRGFAIDLPPDARFFRGDSESPAYQRWRAGLGHVDLVLIDANHNYHAVRRDFEINRAHPHRFLAFHDITGATRQTTGVKKLWTELAGEKRELVHPGGGMGLGIWRAA